MQQDFWLQVIFHESVSPKPLSKFAKVAKQLFFKIRKFLGLIRNHKSANFWDMQVRKFLFIDPQIANPQILLVSQSANCKSANFSL